MNVLRQGLAAIKTAFGRRARRRARDESGAVSPIFALMIVPIVGGLGMATEASNWYLTHRAMQNAADSAAIAAATNGTTTCATVGDFCYEAKAAAARSGYADGANSVMVSPLYMTSGCPGSVTACYKVTIRKSLPVYLLQVVGAGSTQTVQVASIARATTPGATDCFVALGATGKTKGTPSFKLAGGPNTNLQGCSIYSNGNADCTNGGQNISYGQTAGSTSNNCGIPLTDQPPVYPYQGLSANIPANPCTSYPQATGLNIAAAQRITASSSWASPVQICGNALVAANITVTTGNAILVVYGGSLDLYGHTLSTSGSGSLTIIFSGPAGTDSFTAAQYPVDTVRGGGGVIDIEAPTTGNFGGVAMMQDINVLDSRSGNLDLTYSGNSPTLDVQGLIYFPNGSFTIDGAINFHQAVSGGTATANTDGLQCIGVIANSITINGTGSIFDNTNVTSQCAAADVVLPTAPGARLALVQ